jgi:excinuclease ABC subunit A
MSKKTTYNTNFNQHINIYGAREHNLKDIDVHIPRNQFVVITGLSGSGKSSLAFDTIYAEGQRRYMDSFSNYAKQFLGTLERPDVDKIDGLSPVISIEQKTTHKSPRSTVGTVTEIYDLLRLLYARTADAYSYNTGEKMVRYTEEQIIQVISEKFSSKKIAILAPMVRGRKGHYRELFEDIRKMGYLRVRIDGELQEMKPKMQLDRYKIHDIEIVVDRFEVQQIDLHRIRESVANGLRLGKGLMLVFDYETQKDFTFSKTLICPTTGISYEEPSPNTFSFNSPYGACPKCNGLGVVPTADIKKIVTDDTLSIKKDALVPLGKYRDNQSYQLINALAKKHGISLTQPWNQLNETQKNIIFYGDDDKSLQIDLKYNDIKKTYNVAYEGLAKQIEDIFLNPATDALKNWASNYVSDATCSQCNGTRLKNDALFFKIDNKNIAEIATYTLDKLAIWIQQLEHYFEDNKKIIAKDILKELQTRIGFLLDVGLNYLHLNRHSGSLSGGESQRIRLASQIGSLLKGITYILDEPSIGLHQRDNNRLIKALRNLTNIGNTVLVVEHDKDIMLASDYIIDIGPGAGIHGGEIVNSGIPKEFIQKDSNTANYLSNRTKIEIPKLRRKGNGKKLVLKGANGHNLQNVDLEIPLGTFTCITGVSGSGKSTLINDTLYKVLNQYFYNTHYQPMPYKSIDGLQYIDKVIEIDQSPIGRTPRSNPVTYIGVFDHIRNLFANIPASKIRGYKSGRFSFNVQGGRCEECMGGGMKIIEMNFLPDVHVQCPKCLGKRYNRETLEVKYKEKSIYDVLEMTVEEAVVFFEAIPSIYRKINTLLDVGLGYIKLGQSSTTLSGGEAQRIKLAEELSKKDTGNTIYILDEPTTGLHFQDIDVLLNVLQKLVDKGNTIVVIEHNMDVIKVADWIIDLGPEGGNGGGRIVAKGTPQAIIKITESITGQYLKKELSI